MLVRGIDLSTSQYTSLKLPIMIHM